MTHSCMILAVNILKSKQTADYVNKLVNKTIEQTDLEVVELSDEADVAEGPAARLHLLLLQLGRQQLASLLALSLLYQRIYS